MEKTVEKIVITPKEAMQYLGCGRNCMYEILLKDKNFPAFKLGSKYYINKERLQEWADKQCR